MMQLRDYQIEISTKGLEILKNNKMLYLSMEVRTGKTLTALNIANLYGAKRVAFITKKKAISSIEQDYKDLNPAFELEVINTESQTKLTGSFDVVISDEHHKFGAYPKMGKHAKDFKAKFGNVPIIMLSGTPTPESYSQIYNQLAVSNYNPFKLYTTFYKWAKDFVNIKQKHLGYAIVNDYSDANYIKIKPFINPIMISYTKKQAGFVSTIKENFLRVKMQDSTYQMLRELRKNNLLAVDSENPNVVADTGAKMLQKCHQIASGTILTESGKAKIIDKTKAEFIKYQFKNKKIGIFYKFKAEFEMLKQVFGENLCDNLEEFNKTDKNIALQIISGREGVKLSKADYLVFLNIDFSATSYFQAIDRMTTIERTDNQIFWIFSNFGIEQKIYNAVKNKENYTLKHFKNDFPKPIY
jgi:superfamily II DNA or RNA helicase